MAYTKIELAVRMRPIMFPRPITEGQRIILESYLTDVVMRKALEWLCANDEQRRYWEERASDELHGPPDYDAFDREFESDGDEEAPDDAH